MTLIGNLTRDPELRFAASGTAVLGLGLAVNKSKPGPNGGERVETTSFFNIVAFGTLAENVAASLSKGQRVICTGEPEMREYETKEGEKRTSVELVLSGIGPDLRWATAEPVRNERKEGAAPSGRSTSPAARRPANNEEEPF